MDPVQPYLTRLLTDWRVWGLAALLVAAAVWQTAHLSFERLVWDQLRDRYGWLLAALLFVLVLAVLGMAVRL